MVALSIADRGYVLQNGRIVLSSLQPNGRPDPNAGQWINWQRCHGALDIEPAYGDEGTGRWNSSLADGMGPEGNKIVAEEDTAVMFVEVSYRYTPAIFTDLANVGMIHYESAFNVRERTNQNISNAQNLPLNSC